MTTRRAVRVLAVADADSYLKWSAGTVRALPAEWEVTQVLVDNPIRPSPAQVASGTDDLDVRVLSRSALLRAIRVDEPDVLLLACTGPVVAALTSVAVLRDPRRPVLVTGLPGIALPASRRALELRAGCDLFLLHSHREVAAYEDLARRVPSAAGLEFGLARLPFLAGPRPKGADPGEVSDGVTGRPTEVVFAAQALVPAHRAEREAILLALAGRKGAVVKVRAAGAEQQTHRETWPYADLLTDLVTAGRLAPGAISLRGGSMTEALRTAGALVTVSSTAALEAIALDRPILLLSDFGVDGDLLDDVFADSGCLGTLADLRAGRFLRPRPSWVAANYFHPPAEDDWDERLAVLVSRRRAGLLPTRPRADDRRLAALRRRLRLLLPGPGRVAAQWWSGLPDRGRSGADPAARGRTAPAPLRARRPG